MTKTISFEPRDHIAFGDFLYDATFLSTSSESLLLLLLLQFLHDLFESITNLNLDFENRKEY